MRLVVSGRVLTPEGDPAARQTLALQHFVIGRNAWRQAGRVNTAADGTFRQELEIPEGEWAPGLRLVEAPAGTPPRVVAEGGLLHAERGRLHLDFGEVEQLGDEAFLRASDREPFAQRHAYQVAGSPHPPSQQPLAGVLRTLRDGRPGVVFEGAVDTGRDGIPGIVESPRIAELTEQISLRDDELRVQRNAVERLEAQVSARERDLVAAETRVAELSEALQRSEREAGGADVDLGRLADRLLAASKEEVISMSQAFQRKELDLERTIASRDEELTIRKRTIDRLEGAVKAQAEALGRAERDLDGLRQQLETQVDASALYSNLARQLKSARDQLEAEGVPYTIGKVSVNAKAVLGSGGRQLLLPDVANPTLGGAVADLHFEFLPGAVPEPGAGEVEVPDFSEMTESAVRRAAAAAGLRVAPGYESRGGGAPLGQAVRQAPEAGTRVAEGATVHVVFTKA